MSSTYPIRVGRRLGSTDPRLPGYTSILCLTPSTPYGDLGPYVLRDASGHLMENVYQGSKVYTTTPRVREVYSRFHPRVIWQRDPEIHILTRDQIPPQELSSYVPLHPEQGPATRYLTPQYLTWRRDLFQVPDAVRYPVGRKHRATCQGIVLEGKLQDYLSRKISEVHLLSYVEGRIQLYVPLYQELAVQAPKFQKLLALARKGPILIIEIDGPHQESLEYYRTTYGVGEDFITDHTILATPENLAIMLRDTRHPYGHGYALAELVRRELESS